MNRREWAVKFYSKYYSGIDTTEGNECMVKCPFHDDRVASMSINLNKGLYYCHACGKGGDEYDFYRNIEGCPEMSFGEVKALLTREFGERPAYSGEHDRVPEQEPDTPAIPPEEITRYHKILCNIPGNLEWLLNKRGITKETVKKYKIGFDLHSQRYMIPIYDKHGRCVNIRKYSPNSHGVSKMISYQTGYGTARLYPIQNLEKNEILLCEGEMDCLLANQIGYNAITTTGGANTWKRQWNADFRNKTVYICYDIDEAGNQGAKKVAEELLQVTDKVKIIHLPIVDPPDGDITDYFVALGHSREDLDEVIDRTPWYVAPAGEPEYRPQIHQGNGEILHLSEASEARFINQQICTDVVVSGKDTAPFGYPKHIRAHCTPSTAKCAMCGVTLRGNEYIVDDNDRIILNLISCTDQQQMTTVRSMLGIPKSCKSHTIEVIEQGIAEEVILQPALDFTSDDRPYTTRIAFALQHGIRANSGYRMSGVTVTDPRKQYVTHIMNKCMPSHDNISTFNMNPEVYAKLKIFQPREGESVADKINDIVNDLTHNVTKIYGREDVIVGIDMVYHSALEFFFQGQEIKRGWVEGLIIGDTRSGKSETAASLMKHYQLGEFVTGENTSFAGLIGGMQQNQKRWFVSWGKIPLNDRRLVILDEASGLSERDISNMSGVRSSGIAEIIKIHQEKTHARTRLIWISNTRTGNPLRQYDFGIYAVKELFGKNEDIARLEFAITCASEEVPLSMINRMSVPTVPHIYTNDLCKLLILWIWSRKNSEIKFEEESVEKILKYADKMAAEYTSEIPLVEGANQRIKLARLAIAVAGRLFSTDTTGSEIIVKPEHVDYAYQFLESAYKKASLGYFEFSRQRKEQEAMALAAEDEVVQYLADNKAIAQLLLQQESFRNEDIEYMCDFDRVSVRAHLRFLTKHGMIRKKGFGYVKQPILIRILRERRWQN